ncbi:sn-glycerol-3-phosphate ABC transporter ATP-binding protein UgpC [candidate division TA06 bacterium]|nr:sn-glycerol-3-phosphate ABC transporter ATP-binding protein UgpC [candidate division TA06 bacterium]
MAKVTLRNVSKIYPGDIRALTRANIEANHQEFLVLVGPSGCGKSTALRLIAGLESVTEGEISIGNRVVNDVLPKERDIAMVFQNYALYPHLSVYDNIAFGLKLRRYPDREIRARVREATEILGISTLLNRSPRELSGGERQRVAVGRAIVRKPEVFLFDEPLSNLDAKLRVRMRAELNRLHLRLQTTMIYVTHDQTEAMTLGHRIAVMKEGMIQQIADPDTLYSHPVNRFVAGFIGSPPMNFMEGSLLREDGKFYFDEGSFRVRILEEMVPAVAPYEGKPITMGIRPEDLHDKLVVSKASPENILKASVEMIEPMGYELHFHLKTPHHTFVARLEGRDRPEINQDIELVLDTSRIHFFDKETEASIV